MYNALSFQIYAELRQVRAKGDSGLANLANFQVKISPKSSRSEFWFSERIIATNEPHSSRQTLSRTTFSFPPFRNEFYR